MSQPVQHASWPVGPAAPKEVHNDSRVIFTGEQGAGQAPLFAKLTPQLRDPVCAAGLHCIYKPPRFKNMVLSGVSDDFSHSFSCALQPAGNDALTRKVSRCLRILYACRNVQKLGDSFCHIVRILLIHLYYNNWGHGDRPHDGRVCAARLFYFLAFSKPHPS